MREDFITQGPRVPAFERAVAGFTGSPHAIAVANGTAALHLACLALGVGPGDLVWTSPVSFVASANCARYCGADVDFIDIDPRTFNLSAEAFEEKLAAAARAGRLPKAVIPVHLAGTPCDMAKIGALASARGVAVIEDASHALGAEYPGGRVGDCAHSDIAVLSFHPVKMITTGEGGMLTTRSPDLARRLDLLRSHGITRDRERLHDKDAGGWYYEQLELGYNFRLTDIQAALGTSQMRRLGTFLERRRALAARYRERIASLPLDVQQVAEGCRSSYHLFIVQIAHKDAARVRRAVYDGLQAEGIRTNVHYIPIHLQPYYRALGFRPGNFPAAERYYERALSLPLFPALGEAQQDRILESLRRLLPQP